MAVPIFAYCPVLRVTGFNKRRASTIIVFLPQNKADCLRLRFDQAPIASNAQIL
jgi:hypothetical protein